jgi:uncharacterized SAM-binding protein YcdF (DUF218 family)
LTRFRTTRGPRTAGPGRPRGRWRFLSAAAALLLAAFGAATARLFVWPERGMPPRVDAIVMLDGPGDRLHTALNLARAHRAPVVVISRGSPYWAHGSGCAPTISGVRVICFAPDPATTQGEAEFAGRLSRRYHWHSIVLVTTTPQDTRARLRVSRCFPGSISVMTAPLPAYEWPYALAYEWGATIKALLLQRSC